MTQTRTNAGNNAYKQSFKPTEGNMPFDGLIAMTTNDSEKLIGTEFKPNEKVYLLLETLAKEKDGGPLSSWVIEVAPEEDSDAGPFLIPLSLLVLSKKSKTIVKDKKRYIESEEG